MKIKLLENQIDIILKSLENYTKIDPNKMQLIYSTYESLLAQKTENKTIEICNTNVTQMIHKTYWQIGYLCIYYEYRNYVAQTKS